MGFGSYDESEQGNQTIDADDIEDDGLAPEAGHQGTIEYEFDASNEELLDRLKDIKSE